MYKSKYYEERASKTNMFVSLPLGIAGLFFVVFFIYIGIDFLGDVAENDRLVSRAAPVIREELNHPYRGITSLGMTDDTEKHYHGRVYAFMLDEVLFADTILEDVTVKVEINNADPYRDHYRGSEEISYAMDLLQARRESDRNLSPEEESDKMIAIMDSMIAAN
jgi:hypothetical protein